jgi:anthranilate 1,2-dioxygenase small subunit
MNVIRETDIRASTLRADLRDFYDDYAACLDEVNLEGWINFFTDDCHYRVISQENMQANLPLGLIYCMNKNMLVDRVTAIRETTMYEPRMLRHFISGVKINSIEGDVIRSQANFLITEALSDQEPTLNLVGQYQDVIVRTDNGFLLQSRDCVYDNYRIRNSLIIPI